MKEIAPDSALKDRLSKIAKDRYPVIKYGEGRITHVISLANGAPIMLVCWLSRDCRNDEVRVEDIEHIIHAIPFNDRTLAVFRETLDRIETLLPKHTEVKSDERNNA